MKKSSFYIALFVVFIDLMGVGLVYPIFSSMLFDSEARIISAQTSSQMRETILALLIALSPLAQFFGVPIGGPISDRNGRKNLLLISILVGVGGYVIATPAI